MGYDVTGSFRAAFTHIIKQAKRGTQARVSKEAGLYGSQVGDILSGRRPGSEEQRRAIAAALGYTYEDMLSLGQWILEGKDPRLFAAKEQHGGMARYGLTLGKQKGAASGGLTFRSTLYSNVTDGPDITRSVPLISFVQAGAWTGIIDDFQPGEAEEWVPVIRSVGKNAFALRVSGTSMEPDYREGDIIVVDPDVQWHSGSLVVVRLNGDNEATFKKLAVDGSRIYLEPLNTRYQPMEITGKDYTICGVVRQMLRDVY